MWPGKWHQGSLTPEPGTFTWSCSLAPSFTGALMFYSRGLSFSQWTHLAAALVDLSSRILDLFFLISSCCEKQLAAFCSELCFLQLRGAQNFGYQEVRIPVL